ncbi:hypothetical protein BKA70DRAFT_1316825 [Coprinopsis sp. MPI-PUGE-AT-0042]|nr:hypothetical protein BKA70DRAFT_1316825 [Coprinopsis sp. MPI-PUGE-AT-0042]
MLPIDQKILDAAGSKGLKYLQKNRLEHCERRILVTSFRSAVRRLPAEIIAHIICLTLDVYRKPLTHTERQELMALRTVSSLWRATIFSTPAIWQSLEVNFTLRTWSATAVTSWFSRGGLGGLKHLSVKNSKWFSETPDVDQILKFIDHSPFLFSGLSFSLPTLSDIKVLARPSAARATVKILTLLLPCPPGGHDHRSVGTSKKSLKLGESFPRLASLVLRGHLQTHTPFTHPSLASLAFDEGHLTPSYFLRFSERFPSLQDLTVHRGTFLEYNDILELPSNHLKNLKRLTLGGFCIPYVLRAFDCPSIQWLHLASVHRNVWSNPPFPNDLESFLQRSQANDITLRITTEEHDLENLAWMLPAILISESLPVNRLHVTGIDWLDCRTSRPTPRFPSSLREIVALAKPREPRFIRRFVGSLSSVGSGRSSQIIEVYIPGEEEDEVVLASECPDGETAVHLRFHSTTKEDIEDMLVRDNSISGHQWEAVLAS